jgi:hypothetical protein
VSYGLSDCAFGVKQVFISRLFYLCGFAWNLGDAGPLRSRVEHAQIEGRAVSIVNANDGTGTGGQVR